MAAGVEPGGDAQPPFLSASSVGHVHSPCVVLLFFFFSYSHSFDTVLQSSSLIILVVTAFICVVFLVVCSATSSQPLNTYGLGRARTALNMNPVTVRGKAAVMRMIAFILLTSVCSVCHRTKLFLSPLETP